MAKAKPAELLFPVLCLSQDSSISVAESAERLHRCNALALFKNRYYDNLLVIDSKADRFRVERAEVVPALSAVGRWTARVLNRKLQVELQLEQEGSGSLDDAKRIVSEWLGRAPDFWEASRDIEEWREMVARAGTVGGLIALFS
ncbi:MAG TPA: hypothetical protein VFU31_16260 [Candidatus Binatia bacterium]|nr:hypothetical protein [Candidatus Binatia bacterium]